MTVVEKKIPVSLCESPIPLDFSKFPEFDAHDYTARIDRLLSIAEESDFDSLIVYGDREHFFCLHYLTGFDPRFEEALLVLSKGSVPCLIAGNEGMGYSAAIPFELERALFEPFSLMGQPLTSGKTLSGILSGLIAPGAMIGCIGWKRFSDPSVLDFPSFIVDALLELTERRFLKNAADLLMDTGYGLFHHISAKEAVAFEMLGTKASRNVYGAIKSLRPGMSELEASSGLGLDGEPLSVHPNINFGDKNVSYGLASPTSSRRLAYGDLIGVGMGYRGTLVHRCGLYIRDASELVGERSRAMGSFYRPYFASIALWYSLMKIGTSFGDIYETLDRTLGLRNFGVGLNPGHLIHTYEWTNSPFSPGSKERVRSGMAIQCDYTASVFKPYLSAHIEDGLIIADEALCSEIAALSPESMERITARKEFMRSVLGFDLPDEVLPLSDLCGVCFPYMADTSVILAVE